MRSTDRIAVVGIFLVALGAAVFFFAHNAMPVWAKFLVAPLLWYFGIALLLVWALLRAVPALVHPLFADEEETAPEIRPELKPVPVSNFLEHDCENVA